ncbi:MAG: hypothetical protein R3253_10220 [Longimicrobiales bacterium]|nr:hypothetical protein [Longimicrobiales bacterium]
MTPVPRIGRALDLVGLIVFLLGLGMFVRSWIGFRREVPAFEPSATDPPMAAVELADGFWRLQRIGAGVMVVGVAIFVLAWWIAGRASTSTEASPTPE